MSPANDTGYRFVIKAVLCLITILGGLYCFDIHYYLRLTFFVEQYLGLILAMILGVGFLSTRAKKSLKQFPVPWYDILFAFGGVIIGGYLMIKYPAIVMRSGQVDPVNVVLGILALVVVFEIVRRLVGWTLIILTASMLFYTLFSDQFPGVLKLKPIPWERLIHYLYTDNNALIGMPLKVTMDTVFPFLLFGSLLFTLGGGELLCNFAMAVFGRFRGGPAKVSVLSSSLFGTISGSAVANVVVDGPVTIPLMQKVGYDKHTAAAIEAITSTGGQIMPPVMGLSAFLIAEFLNIPYSKVALSALIPALLYYICIYVQIDREAAKKKMKALLKEEIPKLSPIIKEGLYFIIPFLTLVYTLFVIDIEAGRAGMWAVVSTIGAGLLKKKTREILRTKWIAIMEETGRTVVEIGAVTIIAGLVIGLSSVSGLSSILTIEIVRYGGGNLFVLLVLVASLCMILGMGIPTAACYILLAVMIGPSIEKLGAMPLASHLFIFYFGCISMITPPVCLAVYAAAAIAGSRVMRTGYIAMRLGVTAYLVPFLFVYSPELLMEGPLWKVILTFITAVIGVILMGMGFVGYCKTNLGPISRILAVASGAALVVPPGGGVPYSVLLNIVGAIIGIGVVLSSYVENKKSQIVKSLDVAA